MTAWVCDWTHWQGTPLPAARVEGEGYDMVKLKAGGAKISWSFIDPTFLASAEALQETDMIPAAYWYMMPDNPYAQAGLFYDTLLRVTHPTQWATFLDLEEPGITWESVIRFCEAWRCITDGKPLACYTSKRYWNQWIMSTSGRVRLGLFLEEARWVPESVRKDPARPYASQQAHAIDPSWWNINYGGWTSASMLQFTDYALVASKRTTASIFRGSKEELRSALL